MYPEYSLVFLGNNWYDPAASPALTAEFMMAAASLSTESPVTRFVTDGLGPSPKTNTAATAEKEAEKAKDDDDEWEWDGTVNEDAHLDLDDW